MAQPTNNTCKIYYHEKVKLTDAKTQTQKKDKLYTLGDDYMDASSKHATDIV